MSRSIFLLCLVAATYGAAVRSSAILPNVPNQKRIVGGEKTTIEEFPYQVALFLKAGLYCGGSIIRENIILTSAHCTNNNSASEFSIRAGSSYFATGGSVKQVVKKFEHEEYNITSLLDYDYSILFLSESLKYGPTIRAIALPQQGQETEPDTTSIVTGWGFTSFPGKESDVLRKVYLPIVSRERCVPLLRPDPVTDRMICAGPVKGGKGACKGDSGGPLVVNDELIGITSWGHECDSTVSVFAKVSYVVDWINDIISSE